MQQRFQNGNAQHAAASRSMLHAWFQKVQVKLQTAHTVDNDTFSSMCMACMRIATKSHIQIWKQNYFTVTCMKSCLQSWFNMQGPRSHTGTQRDPRMFAFWLPCMQHHHVKQVSVILSKNFSVVGFDRVILEMLQGYRRQSNWIWKRSLKKRESSILQAALNHKSWS